MYIHHSESDLINIMDHMSISGTEPSSVILLPIFVHIHFTDICPQCLDIVIR